MNEGEYRVVWAEDTDELSRIVNEVMNTDDETWECTGGVASEVYPQHPPRYYQSLIRVN